MIDELKRLTVALECNVIHYNGIYTADIIAVAVLDQNFHNFFQL